MSFVIMTNQYNADIIKRRAAGLTAPPKKTINRS